MKIAKMNLKGTVIVSQMAVRSRVLFVRVVTDVAQGDARDVGTVAFQFEPADCVTWPHAAGTTVTLLFTIYLGLRGPPLR